MIVDCNVYLLPCTVSVALLLSTSAPFLALQNITVLLYTDDTVTDRFLVVTSVSIVSIDDCVNPLLVTDPDDAAVLLTLYSIFSVSLAVQVNSTVLPSTAAIDLG